MGWWLLGSTPTSASILGPAIDWSHDSKEREERRREREMWLLDKHHHVGEK